MQIDDLNLPRGTVAFLGFITCIPIFLLPDWPFVHINTVDPWLIYPPHVPGISTGVHPSYTFSLGLAAPICVVTTVLGATWASSPPHLGKIKVVVPSLLIITGLIALYVLTQSIRVLGFWASVIGLMFLTTSSHENLVRNFAQYAVAGLITFACLHAVYLFYIGIDRSMTIDAFVFYGVEIYQALVSYPAVLAFLAGSIVLVPRTLLFFGFNDRGLIYNRLFFLIVLSAIVFVVVMLGRRISIVTLALAASFFILGAFLSIRKFSYLLVLPVLGIGALWLLPQIYQGVEAISYVNMIEPRMKVYLPIIHEIFDEGLSQSLFFGYADGWAAKHNMILDTIYFSGLIGLAVVGLILANLVYLMKGSGVFTGMLRSKDKKIYSLYALAVLFIDNMVNQNLTMPYYTISVTLTYCYTLACINYRKTVVE